MLLKPAIYSKETTYKKITPPIQKTTPFPTAHPRDPPRLMRHMAQA
jgi:hypothetical protein